MVVDMAAQGMLWFSKELRDLTIPAASYKTCMNAADWADLSFAPPDTTSRPDMTRITWADFVLSMGT
jgi:hypothetical protein